MGEQIGAPNLFLREVNVVHHWVIVQDLTTIVVRRILIVIRYDL